jgi:hypothetical protein
MKPYRELLLVHSDLKATVDAEDFLRLSRFRWHIQHSNGYLYVYRLECVDGRYKQLTLAHAVLDVARSVRVRRINQEGLDYRRSNLKITDGSIYSNPHSKRRPFAVCITIDQTHFYVGSWPTSEEAEQAQKIAAQEAATLRGRGLAQEAIQRAIDLATGYKRRGRVSVESTATGEKPARKQTQSRKENWRALALKASRLRPVESVPVPLTEEERAGREILSFAASVLPKILAPEIREDAMQAICLDLIAGNIEAGELKDRRIVGRYIADARGLNDRFRFISTDAPIGDTDLTVGDRLVA